MIGNHPFLLSPLRYDLDVGELARLGYLDEWFVLDQIKKGKIHLRALWLNFSLDVEHIKKVRFTISMDF